jgi:tRNA (guanine-N7-)-methyltransferase
VRIESHYFVQYLLPPGSVDIFHIMFPDPWPKRRHQAHRLIQTDFLDVVRRALGPGGELRLTTDNQPYFEHMRSVFEPHPGFVEEPWEPGPDYPQTDFERGFRAQGLPIYRARLRKK